MFGKVSAAVGELVIGAGDARNRVRAASEYLFAMDAQLIPNNCKEDLKWILHMLTRYPAGGGYKSAAEATISRTRNATASKIAARIWYLYNNFSVELRELQVGERT